MGKGSGGSGRSSSKTGGGSGSSGGLTKQPTNIKEFATAALAAARNATGSGGLVLISRAFDQYRVAVAGDHDMASFKAQLWDAAKQGLIKIASHDMPQILNQRERERSTMTQGPSTFLQIRL